MAPSSEASAIRSCGGMRSPTGGRVRRRASLVRGIRAPWVAVLPLAPGEAAKAGQLCGAAPEPFERGGGEARRELGVERRELGGGQGGDEVVERRLRVGVGLLRLGGGRLRR